MTPDADLPAPPLVPDQALAGYWQRILGFGIDIFLMFGVTVGIAIAGGVEFDDIAVTDGLAEVGAGGSVHRRRALLRDPDRMAGRDPRQDDRRLASGRRKDRGDTHLAGPPPIRWAIVGIAGVLPVPFLSVVVYGVVALDPRRRGLHDFGAGTVVVDVRRYRETETVISP